VNKLVPGTTLLWAQ